MSIETNKKKRVKTFQHPGYHRGSPPFCAHTSAILENSLRFQSRLEVVHICPNKSIIILDEIENSKFSENSETAELFFPSFPISDFSIIPAVKSRKLIILHLSWMHFQIKHAQFALRLINKGKK